MMKFCKRCGKMFNAGYKLEVYCDKCNTGFTTFKE